MTEPVIFRSDDMRRALDLSDPGAAENRSYTGVSADSRAVQPGHLFVALAGERVDGAEFLEDACARGAAGAIVPHGRELAPVDIELFAVADPLQALGSLASHYRHQQEVRVVGITGTSGKTTVKEMVACALSDSASVYRSEGNLNSQVGLPLSILSAPPGADVWVLELGASEPGEIARLTEICDPDDAIVTTVGPAHLEAFGNQETVLEEKLTLVAGARRDGFVVVGEKPPILAARAVAMRPGAIVAGLGENAAFRPERVGIEAERCWFLRDNIHYEVPVGGEHHLRDALLAVALGDALGSEPLSLATGLARFRPVGMRSAVHKVGELTVLADCYNANPESFEAAIAYCTTAFRGRRLAAVVGSMLELGDASESAHRDIARRLANAGFSLVAATGEFEPAIQAVDSRNGTRIVHAADADAIWDRLASELTGDEVVLVKGSRGVRLERIVERLRERFGGAQDGDDENRPVGREERGES
jgi:UDP-N-acetylmuramoyl-tripeptide--D-alanyl-D-alanine ligase